MLTTAQYTPKIIERFYSKVSTIPTERGCLEWLGYCNDLGYGIFCSNKKKMMAHRVAWILANGPIPEGMVIRHFICSNPQCCRVEHLRAGTQADNIHDMVKSGRHHNAPNTYVRPIRLTREEQFYSQISKTPTATGCIEWLGRLNEHGYGVFSFPGKSSLAHRIAWELAYGPIPEGLKCLHKCDNPKCLNVGVNGESHIWLGTMAENVHDMWAKGRANHSIRFGEDIATSKLTAAQVKEIRSPRYEFWAGEDIAGQFGISETHVSSILNRVSWRHLDSSGDAPIRDRQPRGERQGGAKLTEAQVLEIRGEKFQGLPHHKIAEQFGVSQAVISGILRRASWTHLDSSGDAPIMGEKAHGRHIRGVKNVNAKLTEEQVIEMRSEKYAQMPQREVAKCFGITQNAVWSIRHRETWKHV